MAGCPLDPGTKALAPLSARGPFVIIATHMRLLRMKPGYGEVLIAEGDVEVPAQERELVDAFRAQLDAGMWAAVPSVAPSGRREAELVREFPREAERVIFFPRAAGGAGPA